MSVPYSLWRQAPPLAGFVNVHPLTANTPVTITAPADLGQLEVLFNFDSGARLYVRSDGEDAAVPALEVTDGTGSQPIDSGSARQLSPAQEFSAVTDADTILILTYHPMRAMA